MKHAKFSLLDKGIKVATLICNNDVWELHVLPDAVSDNPYISLPVMVGKLDLDHKYAMDLISSRVAPPTRHNIANILKAAGIPYYHEALMLRAFPRCDGSTLVFHCDEIVEF